MSYRPRYTKWNVPFFSLSNARKKKYYENYKSNVYANQAKWHNMERNKMFFSTFHFSTPPKFFSSYLYELFHSGLEFLEIGLFHTFNSVFVPQCILFNVFFSLVLIRSLFDFCWPPLKFNVYSIMWRCFSVVFFSASIIQAYLFSHSSLPILNSLQWNRSHGLFYCTSFTIFMSNFMNNQHNPTFFFFKKHQLLFISRGRFYVKLISLPFLSCISPLVISIFLAFALCFGVSLSPLAFPLHFINIEWYY